MSRTVFALFQCPVHHGYRITIEDYETGSGSRVAGDECCADQYKILIDKFHPDWREVARHVDKALEDEAEKP